MDLKFSSVAATPSNPNWNNLISRKDELYKKENDVRSEFERDYDRIIYCNAYRRLKHKTQVFFLPKNDHICTRIEHVNNVDATSYTIAKALGLNTTLTRAISISHDIGHSPFGHKGEQILNRICMENDLEAFWHERNGLNFVDNIELLTNVNNEEKNLNLTYAVRDGIISHCGEIDEISLKPRTEFIDLEKDYIKLNQYSPYTWEGCVVKISDKISYLGRDIEDAISMGILDSNLNELYDLLEQPRSANLNNTNIIGDLIADLCLNSSANEGLKFSTATFEKIKRLKQFNYKYIYKHKCMNPSERYFSLVLNEIFNTLNECYDGMNTLEKLNSIKPFYTKVIDTFIKWISCYWNIETDRTHLKNKILYDMNNIKDYQTAIITYISGMTDSYAIETYNDVVKY
ncbi:dGTP triphosphohydrolase [Clostridium sp. CAG:354]|jgi:dGTPase|nr:HD domain-containing protein [Clostridia bacterium]CDE10952.1 dGTP triphosphohydrolase [Clostridium sp. CAG:354]